MNRTLAQESTIARRRTTRRWKLIGLGFAALPVVILAVFAAGEGLAGEPGWWSHLLQLAGVGLLTAFAWLRPRIGGPVLVAVGAVLSVAMLVASRGPVVATIVVVLVVFAPLIVAGVFFARAADS